MGQHGSKSTIEARVIFQRGGSEDMSPKRDACSTPASVVRIQKKVNSQVHSSNRSLEKSSPHSWSLSRRDSEGLVYVMDNPTGGVWSHALSKHCVRKEEDVPVPSPLTVFRPTIMGLRGSKLPEAYVPILGLDNAGKSTLLYKLKHNACVGTVPTIGFNVEMIEAKKNRKTIAVTLWDVGGQSMMREHWKNFHQDSAAVVFVVDSADRTRMDEARRELENTLRSELLKGRPLIVIANKQDVNGALTATEIKDTFHLKRVCTGRDWFVQPCSASTGFGVEEAFRRVVQLAKLPSEPGAMKENIKDTVHYLKTTRRH
ncbi:ADP-ribosylation factor-like protein 14 [Xyrichtys novacula]|uniref:ADP-ribosylation factor-like protein 14 n=1 Tax=Xyrichtys novacula TaxID=13765 RepID=A0AAV1GF92_XYRNO|nr:ADP-ribosylation factor-like protein 14 [Xyrichtys novacula]